MTDKQIAAANPSAGQIKAEIAFGQLPDVNMKVGKIEKWPGAPAPAKRDEPLIPPALLGRVIEMNGNHEENAAKDGLYPVRITHTHGDGSPSDIVGPYGKILQHGHEYELPGGAALQLATQKSAA